jgi:hypothetical protein
MNTLRLLGFVIALMSLNAHALAQEYSGDAGGGMDAKGNPCNTLPMDDWRTAQQQAIEDYEAGHYANAVANFRLAAKLGDAQSAEILALMYRLGDRQYGSQVVAMPGQVTYWVAKAAEARFKVSVVQASTQQ